MIRAMSPPAPFFFFRFVFGPCGGVCLVPYPPELLRLASDEPEGLALLRLASAEPEGLALLLRLASAEPEGLALLLRLASAEPVGLALLRLCPEGAADRAEEALSCPDPLLLCPDEDPASGRAEER